MITTVFLFTFSCVLNRQCFHYLFKNQMIKFNYAIQLNFCNLQCSLETCLLHLHTPMGPGPAFTFAMLPWDLCLLSLLQCSLETRLSPAPHVLLRLRKHLKTRLKCVTSYCFYWTVGFAWLQYESGLRSEVSCAVRTMSMLKVK